jgi:Zn-dependent protease with chaperone function
MTTLTSNGRITLPLLSAETFTCKADQIALANLQKMPLLPQIVRQFNETAGDRFFYAINSADSIRCADGQFTTLFKIMQEASLILDAPEPELYIRYSPKYNAYTAGINRTFIVIQSAIAESFTNEELLFIVGHEIGHIKCGHILYQMVGRLLVPLIEALGQATLGIGQIAGMGIVGAFYEWMRQAEFSCDRAGLLACQNPRVALSAIMKLGCGNSRFNDEMNLDLFLEQARQHSEAEGAERISKILLFLMYNWQLDHPQVVYRAQQLDQWVNSGEYDRIISGDYAQDAEGGTQIGPKIQCKTCSISVPITNSFCPKCGTKLFAKD